jgi:hypothetical protein
VKENAVHVLSSTGRTPTRPDDQGQESWALPANSPNSYILDPLTRGIAVRHAHARGLSADRVQERVHEALIARAAEEVLAEMASIQAQGVSGDRHEGAMTEVTIPSEYLAPAEAAVFLRVTPETLDHLRKTKKVRTVQIGDQRGFVYAIADLREFAASRTISTGEEERRRRSRR